MPMWLRLTSFAFAATLSLQPVFARDTSAAPDVTYIGKINADTPLQGPGGVEITGAADWSVRRTRDMLLIDAPENDATLALVDLDAPNAAAAVNAAWLQFRPGVKRVPRVITKGLGRTGWDDRAVASYDISANARMAVSATALRSGRKWAVVLLEGALATVQKRGAALEMMQGSVRPRGYKAESFAGRKANRLDPARIARIRAFVETGIKALRIPGAGLALLQDGKVVYEGGVGVRKHGRQPKVDARTMFMVASNTKPMTTLLLASLADAGKLRWDQPVIELYPGFKLGDPETTSKVQFKHLVCACTGLPKQNMEMMFEFGRATSRSSIDLLASIKPTSKFGELYQYSNLMASAAGYIGAALAHPGVEAGAAYDNAMHERIFSPLGMSDTTFDFDKALAGNHASPHTIDYANRLRVTGTEMDRSIVPYRPAGGIWTSARDFIRYVQLEANEGRLSDGTQLVSRANLLARRIPQVASGDGLTYGMGLETMMISGIPIINHGGSLPGFKSNFLLLPDGVGAVLMTNADDGYALLSAFQRYLLEELYDGKPEAADDLRIASASNRHAHTRNRSRYTVPPAPSVIGQLAARYGSRELGELAVIRKGSQAFIDVGEWKTAVATRKNKDGTASLLTITPGLDNFQFVVGSKDRKRTLTLHDGQHQYVFSEL